MFVFYNLLTSLAHILEIALTIFYWLILLRALISWVDANPLNPIVQFLYNATEPVLAPLRKIMPINYRFGIDFSPLVAFLIIIFLKSFLVSTLIDIAFRLKLR
jgi:YggT family protein